MRGRIPTSTLADQGFTVGEWLVLPRLSQIRHGRDTIHVTPRAMTVLVHLAEARGAVLSRNDILDAVWPRMTVTPDALSRCLVELRKAFGDDSRLIETIPKVGIRLTAPAVLADTDAVEAADAAMSRARARRVALPRAAAALLIAGGLLASAVFWAANRSTNGTRADIPTSNARARDFYLSANEYSRRPNRLEALQHQEDLYRRATLEDPQFALAWASLGKTHTSMYWYGLDRTSARLASAEQAIRRALELQADLPEAHLYLGDYYFKGLGNSAAALGEFAIAERSLPADPELHFLRSSVYRRVGEWDLAVRDGAAAIELDPRNIVYRRQQHITYMFMRDYARAAQTLDGILELVPDDGTTYVDKVVIALCRDGDTAVAGQYEKAPPTEQYDDGLAYTYTRWLAAIFDRDYARALGVLDGAPEAQVFNGDLRTTRIPKTALYARTHLLAGDAERAAQEFRSASEEIEKQLAVSVADDVVATSALHMGLAEAQAALGERDQALASLHRARNLLPKSTDALSGSATQLAAVIRVLIPAADVDGAVRELDDYLGGPGNWSIEGLLADPRLDPIRTDPGFLRLVQKHRREGVSHRAAVGESVQ